MAKEKKVSMESGDMTGEQIADQLILHYELISQSQMSIQQLQIELNRRRAKLQKLEEKPKG